MVERQYMPDLWGCQGFGEIFAGYFKKGELFAAYTVQPIGFGWTQRRFAL